MLPLFGELFLLALNEHKGKIPRYINYSFHIGLGGAILADLIVRGNVKIDDSRKVDLLDSRETGDSLLDNALLTIIQTPQPHRIPYWLDVFGHHKKKLLKNVGDHLVDRGFLQKIEKRYLGVIKDESYPQSEVSARYLVKQHLRSTILAGGIMDDHTRVLLSLTYACNLLDHCFTRDEIKTARRRIQEIIEGELVGQAVNDAIDSLTQNAR